MRKKKKDDIPPLVDSERSVMTETDISQKDMTGFLEAVINCKTKTEYDRACIRFFARYATPVHQRGNLWLRRIVWRYLPYKPKCKTLHRNWWPWSWTDMRILEFAYDAKHDKTKFGKAGELRVDPDVEYLGLMMWRSPEDVQAQLDRQQHEGFDI